MNADQFVAQVVEVAVVRPGDTLVLRLPESATLKQYDEVVATIRERIPGDDFRILAVGGGIEIYVLRPGEVAE